ncbi:MAG: hypothetical protein Q7U35_11945 [Methanobacteriaceae archaeon]|nr:hypothetical protein [Methanobacteriaceae archaeon]MDP2836459.1 hypothetical protein [Methanobacteriaceae archaeon]MDP3035660.1 hypothetical protein [Methanobacteriaceae archaeon]MDP3486207.1 hypothetical protein [Methanobacteriaceae archaeon]MDP3624688.1 hypothetical protein [Methanobacteriaceae archaeon]
MHVEVVKYADLINIKIELPVFLEYLFALIPFLFIRQKKVRHNRIKHNWAI